MSQVDLAITNARLVTSAGIFPGTLLIEGERIAGILTAREAPQAERIIDAEGRFVIPGVIDPHTHPGCRNPLEADFRTVSEGAAAGGVTTYGVMVGSGRASWTFQDFVEEAPPWGEAFPVLREIGEENSGESQNIGILHRIFLL